MSSIFFTRKYTFFNLAFLFLLVIVWTVSYMQPVMRSFFKDDHVFYGKVSYAAIPSLFGGSGIPFLDKTFFKMNGDENATFVLYASPEMIDDMSSWFSFAAKNVEDIPIEIYAARIDEKTFIVKSIATEDNELDWDSISEYHLFYCLVGLCLDFVCFVFMVIFIVLGFTCKRKR